MARVIAPFDGVPDGEVYPKGFAVGDEVLGALAVVAIAEGWAVADLGQPQTPLRAEYLPGILRILKHFLARVSAFIRQLRDHPAN